MVGVSPMQSVARQTAAWQRQLLAAVPKKLQPLARFGLRALVFTPFVSGNANARMTGSGQTRAAAEMRMYRLLRHGRLASRIMAGIRQAVPVTAASVLNIDFCNFGAVAVLVAAQQTKHGRALPWALETLPSNIQGLHTTKLGYTRRMRAYRQWKTDTGGDQFDAVIHFVAALDEQAGCQPRLVFDRGFANKRLLAVLFARSGNAYVRFREHYYVTLLASGRRCRAASLRPGDYAVRWQGQQFRLVVTTTSGGAAEQQPWVIATNDQASTPGEIATLYYHRFEIEETFRDWKSCLGVGKARLSRFQSLDIILSFASAGLLLAWLVRGAVSGKAGAHAKKCLSFFRQWQEQLQRVIRQRGLAALTGG